MLTYINTKTLSTFALFASTALYGSGCVTICHNGFCEEVKSGQATYKGPPEKIEQIKKEQSADTRWKNEFNTWLSSAPQRTEVAKPRIILHSWNAIGSPGQFKAQYFSIVRDELSKTLDFEEVKLTRRDIALARSGNDWFTPHRLKAKINNRNASAVPLDLRQAEEVLAHYRFTNKADLVLSFGISEKGMVGVSKTAGLGTAQRASWAFGVLDLWSGEKTSKVGEGGGKFQFSINTRKTGKVDKVAMSKKLGKMGVNTKLWAKVKAKDEARLRKSVRAAAAQILEIYRAGKPDPEAVKARLTSNPRPKHHEVPTEAPSMQDALRSLMAGKR